MYAFLIYNRNGEKYEALDTNYKILKNFTKTTY